MATTFSASEVSMNDTTKRKDKKKTKKADPKAVTGSAPAVRKNNAWSVYAVPAILTAALIFACVWGSSESARAEEYKTGLESSYTRAYNELANSFSDMDAALKKLSAAGSPARSVLLLDDIWRLSGAAVSLMSQLPSSHVDTGDLNRFVVQLGDYAHTLTERALRGSPITADDEEQLTQLQEKCAELATKLNTSIESGDIPLAIITNDEYYTASNEPEAGEGAESNAEDAPDDEAIAEFPTLIYDGPFSDSSEKAEAKGLTGGDVTEAEAIKTASELAGVGLTSLGRAEGSIPTYEFEGSYEDGRGIYVSITVQEGRLLYMMSSAKSGAYGVPEQSESTRYRDAAIDYLTKNGYGEMCATYAQYYDGAALINCAAVQDGVILYNDLVKVWVDREDVKIIGVDARNYIFSHVERELAPPSLTEEEARQYLTDRLEVASVELALIPITPTTERLCYEFKGTVGQDSYIVYINANTGDEEEIFMIIDSEDGQLVI